MPQQKPWEKDWGAPQQGPIVLGTPNPTKAPHDQAELVSIQQRNQQGPYDLRKSAADATKAESEAFIAQQKADEAKASTAIQAMGPNSPLQGDEYLKKFVPPAQWNVVKAYARGDLGSRSGGLSTSMLPIIQHAMNYDPSASGVNFPARVKMQSDLASGDPKSAGGSLQAFERMLLHGENVLDQGLALKNFHSGLAAPLNYPRAAWEGFTQDPTLTAFNQSARNYAPEAQKAIAQTSGGQEERLGRKISGASSPEGIAAGLQSDATQAMGAMQSVNDRYKRIMGRDITDMLSPDAKRAYDKIMAGGFGPDGQPLHPAEGYAPLGPSGSDGATPPGAPPSAPPNAPTGSPSGARQPDRSTKWFGNGTDPNGIEKFNIPTSMKGESLQKDPVRMAAAKHLAAMIADRRIPDAAIMDYAQNLDANTASVAANLKFRRDHPTYTGGYNTDSLGFKNVPLTATQWIGNNIGTSPIGTGVIQGANAVSGNSLANLTSNPDATRALIAGTAQMNPKSAFIGNVGGGALAAAGLEAGAGALALKAGLGAKALPWVPRAADAVYGGISGANSNPNDPLGGALLGGVAGVGGGMFGRGAAKAGGAALSGVRNEGVQLLKDRGVPLSFGQAVGQSGWLGGAVKGAEDRLSGLPLVGDMINARRREGVQGFNGAAFKEGLAPIAPLIPPVGQQAVNGVGEQGIGNMQQAVTGAYGRALNGVQVTPDAQFSQELGNALGLGSAIPRTGPEFAHIVGTKIAPHFNSPTGAIDGPQIQDILQTARATNFGHDAMGNEANDAMGNVGGAVSDLVGRQQPGVIPALGAANSGYRNLNILADAVGRGSNTGGLFTPAQLGTAVKSNTNRFGGKIAAASDTRPFFDLQRAGQDILPSKVPDSGTAGRMALATLLPGATSALGGGVGYAAGDTRGGAEAGGEAGIVSLMALAAGGSKTAQKLLTAMVLNRSNSMIAAGQAVGKRAPIAGMFGAGASPLLLPQQ